MYYEEFVHHALYGHEFEGTIDEIHEFSLINIHDDMTAIVIDERGSEYKDILLFNTAIYDGMTFKELFESGRISIESMF